MTARIAGSRSVPVRRAGAPYRCAVRGPLARRPPGGRLLALLLVLAGSLTAPGGAEARSGATWNQLRRRFVSLRKQLTREYPNRSHGDFVHLFATYLSPALIEAEARSWGARLDLSRKRVRARIRRHSRPGWLRFQVEVSNHRWPWMKGNVRTLLGAVELDLDGRRFRVTEVEEAFFDPLLRGQTLILGFRTPEGEPPLPGPSARRIMLRFPDMPSKKRRGDRLRSRPRDRWWIPRIAFERELFEHLFVSEED